MIAVDTNILVYAHRSDSALHDRAFDAVRGLAEGRSPWAIPWPCLHEFLAVTTHPRIYDPPTPMEHAIAQVETWLESPSLILLAEGLTHWTEIKHELLAGAAGPKVHDARVAAMCRSGGVTTLWSVDRDFSRLDISVVNPLATR